MEVKDWGLDDYSQEKQIALTAVLQAAELCQKVKLDVRSQAIEKPDSSPVTIADYGAQALICETLRAAFPDDPILGEEDARLLADPGMAACLGQVTRYVQYFRPQAEAQTVLEWVGQGQGQPAARFWTLDPIDGTKGYVRGDQYAVALALIEQGQVVLGAIACPELPASLADPTHHIGVVFLGIRGQGASMLVLNTQAQIRLRVNQDPAQRESWRLIESVERDHGTPTWQQAIAKKIGLTRSPFQMDSLAKYGVIARGEADLYMRLPSGSSTQRRENIWDHAAGVLMLQEAGGRVTDQTGRPLDFSCGAKLLNNQGIIASNGILHPWVLQQVPAVVAPSSETR
jgi:3'(2'), 5'-bisphosphate nucleotidase